MSIDLNKGIAVIIDEQIDNTASVDLIHKIVEKINEKGIPCCKFSSLKNARLCLSNLLEINFLVLDWQLSVPDGASELIKDENAKDNIKFIEEFKKQTFAPIFIFSSLTEGDILEYFDRFGSGIYKNEPKKDFILIKRKADVVDNDNLFDEVNKWINKNPSVYTIKTWNQEFLAAKNETFWSLFEKSPSWPKILWKGFKKDGVEESHSINEVINKLIFSRTTLENLSLDALNPNDAETKSSEIKEIIAATRYLDGASINKELRPGDIFYNAEQQTYFINIRPDCDTVLSRKGCDGKVYVLLGVPFSTSDMEKYKRYDVQFGLIERIQDVILFGLNKENFVKFDFKTLEIHDYKTLIKSSPKVCRLLPPFINNVQQKYSSYLGRFGLPRIPDEILVELISPPKTEQ